MSTLIHNKTRVFLCMATAAALLMFLAGCSSDGDSGHEPGASLSSSDADYSSSGNVSSSSIDLSSSSSIDLLSSSSIDALSSSLTVSSSSGNSSSSSRISSSSVASSSSSSTDSANPGDGVQFTPEALGVAPGANTSELRFTWYSDDNTANRTTRIRLFSESGSLIKDTVGANGSASGKLWHKAVLTGLNPGTAYKYSVSYNGADWSYRYNIKTPGAGSFKFAAIGDPQIDNDTTADVSASILNSWKKTMAAIGAHNASLVVNAGDVADNGVESEYKDFMSPPEMKNIPLAPAIGNHDFSFSEIMNPIFIDHFNLPNSRGSSYTWWNQANYWYLYNNILFVALNTGLLYPESEAQAKIEVNRFDSLFSAAKSASSGKYDWIIVQHHRSTRSLGPHSYPSSAIQEQYRDNTLPLYKQDNLLEGVFDKHNVSLVIAGHDHIYVRSKPLKGGNEVASGGTVYLTLLPAGSWKFYPLSVSPAPSWVVKSYPTSTSYIFTRKNGYTLFNVSGSSISATVYDNDDGILDEFSLSK